MAPVKFDRIVSVSSEDPLFPAENLLKNAYGDKKWKSKEPGVKQISVVIQMEKAEKIGSIDVGNYGSAFIEVLVSKSSSPDDFKVLVVASSLMTLQEAKLGNNISNVRFFKEDELVKEVASEKWDRMKIICSQPYNKHIQYGLAFIVIHSINSSTTATPSSTVGKFLLKKKDDLEGLTIGSLFAKRKENVSIELKGAAAIRAASSSGIIEKKMSPQIGSEGTSIVAESQLTISDNKISLQNDISELRKNTPNARKANKDKTPKNKPKDLYNGTGGSSTSAARNRKTNKRTAEDVKENVRKRVPAKPRLEKAFNQLFEGVIFTISGFQNPYRSEIRSKALAMGAKYKPDWDNTCTHLLCAFPNTPKFNQVLGHGKIIKKEWIEECYNKRMRLPWRRFSLHPPDKAAPESEDEIFEKVARPPSPVDNRRRISPGRSSGDDTEEEIERVLQIQARNQDANSSEANDLSPVNGNRTPTRNDVLPKVEVDRKEEELSVLQIKPKPSNKKGFVKNLKVEAESQNCLEPEEENASNLVHKKTPKKKKKPKEKESPKLKKRPNITETNEISSSNEADGPEETYNMDTEEEDESCDSKKWNLPPLPVIFDGIKFYVAQDLNDKLQKQLRRYIFAHKGSLIDEDGLLFEEVKFVITESIEEVRKVKVNCKDVIGLRPEWIWKAHDECRIPPTSTFEIGS